MKMILLLTASLICFGSIAQKNQKPLKNFVYDYEKDFTPSQVDSLQQLLNSHYQKSGDELAVLTADSIGANDTEFASSFAVRINLGRMNAANSMVILLTVKGKLFSITPNKKVKTFLTQDDLNKISVSGMKELKAHQFFEGIYKECKAIIDYLEEVEAKNQ